MSVNQGRLAGGFWGLVEQKGPWKTTSNDAARSHRSQPSKKTGGGIEIGGTKNAGHAGWYASINPQVDPNVLPSPPRPSQYVQKSIIVPSTMMPKTPKGTVLRNAPTETMRHDPSGVQKAGHNYVPHFQPSGEEAPRENETPSLMGESSVASDESMMDSEDYKAFEQRIYEATRPPQYEFATQTELKENQDFGLQTSPKTMDTTTSPLVNTMETATSPLVETDATLPYLEAPIEVPYLEPPPGVPAIEPVIEPTTIYPGITEQEMLADRKPKRKIKKKPLPKIDSEEFEKFSKKNRDRYETERDELNRKLPQPKIPTAEFEAHTSSIRNLNRKGNEEEGIKRKRVPQSLEQNKEPVVPKKKEPERSEFKEKSKGLSLDQQIFELEKRVAAYERLKKKSVKGLSTPRTIALKYAREKLAELKKKRK